jgi:hypothetical protein
MMNPLIMKNMLTPEFDKTLAMLGTLASGCEL